MKLFELAETIHNDVLDTVREFRDAAIEKKPELKEEFTFTHFFSVLSAAIDLNSDHAKACTGKSFTCAEKKRILRDVTKVIRDHNTKLMN